MVPNGEILTLFTKVTMQAFKISVQVIIGISKLKRLISKQITIKVVVGMLLSKKQAFQNAGWSNQHFGNCLGSYPWKLHLEVEFFIEFSTQIKDNKK